MLAVTVLEGAPDELVEAGVDAGEPSGELDGGGSGRGTTGPGHVPAAFSASTMWGWYACKAARTHTGVIVIEGQPELTHRHLVEHEALQRGLVQLLVLE